MEICGAHSAGISIFEPEVGQFRWYALAGELAAFDGATTPRNFSPCGVCLDLAQPILMEHPERAYDWIRDAGITVPEVLLVQLTMKGADIASASRCRPYYADERGTASTAMPPGP